MHSSDIFQKQNPYAKDLFIKGKKPKIMIGARPCEGKIEVLIDNNLHILEINDSLDLAEKILSAVDSLYPSEQSD